MAYDPAETTDRDVIRGLILDTDAVAVFADATYESVLARHSTWQGAAAEMARRMARYISNRPTSINAPGDGAISWGDRARTLEALAVTLDAEARLAGLGVVTTVYADYLTGYDEGDVLDG